MLEGVKRLEKVKQSCRKSGSAIQESHSFPEKILARGDDALLSAMGECLALLVWCWRELMVWNL